jgi:acyl-CoA reductase-like NAD-dependent aldehyde dehydrogenase
VEKSLLAVFGNAGQDCCARSRVLIEAGVHDAFVAKFAEATRRLRVGDPLDPATQVSTLISRGHRERVSGYVDVGRQEGARLVCGGDAPREGPLARGSYLMPAVFDRVGPAMRIAREEIFGPVVAVLPFRGRSRGDRARERLDLRPLRLALDARRQARAARRARDRDGRDLGQREPQRLPRVAVRRREAQRPGRELGVEALEGYTSRSRSTSRPRKPERGTTEREGGTHHGRGERDRARDGAALRAPRRARRRRGSSTRRRGEAVVAEVAKEGGEAIAVACDVARAADVEAAVAAAERRFGALHVVFNNAGIFPATTARPSTRPKRPSTG